MAHNGQGSVGSNRVGFALRSLLAVSVLGGVVLTGAWRLLPGLSLSGQEGGPMIHVATRSNFIHDITERGEVESASNVEIRCEVRAKGTSGTTILEIISEGTYVEEGDVLARLDSSALENDRTRQQIVVNSSEAEVVKSRNTYETALIAKQEYLEGQYQQEVQNIQSQIFVAEEDLRRAEEYLNYSKRLATKGYVTPLQLEADQFAVEKAKNQLEMAQTKLRVLKEFTLARMLKQLESDIATSEARYRAQKDSHRLDLEQLALIEEQIENCTMRAPEPGQVVYANQTDRRGTQEIIIAEGEQVREGQVIIRLPDPKRMQAKAKINEARISQVAAGQRATIRLDAFPDRELTGVVTQVNEYPEPTSWHSAHVREYGTTVRIEGSPPGLRPGLTGEVRILVERIPSVLQLPVQAVFEHGGKYYCITPTRGGLEARELAIGSTNDKTVVIREGMEEGDRVILNAAAYRDRVGLPELTSGDEPLVADGPAELPEPGAPRGPGGPESPGGARSGAGRGRAEGGPRGEGGGASAGGQPDPDTIVDRMFARFDRNGDGFLEGDEIPERLRSQMDEIDLNGDGKLDRAELRAALSKLSAGRPQTP